jgi:hypothetical protein
MKFAVLRALERVGTQHAHKMSLIGHPYSRGHLELQLGITFDRAERALAGRAFADLARADLIEPSYSSATDPESCFWITDAGRQAIKRGILDDLDEALNQIDPQLVELREGAWSTLPQEPNALDLDFTPQRKPKFLDEALRAARAL